MFKDILYFGYEFFVWGHTGDVFFAKIGKCRDYANDG
jgi:hypothetical protein